MCLAERSHWSCVQSRKSSAIRNYWQTSRPNETARCRTQRNNRFRCLRSSNTFLRKPAPFPFGAPPRKDFRAARLSSRNPVRSVRLYQFENSMDSSFASSAACPGNPGKPKLQPREERDSIHSKADFQHHATSSTFLFHRLPFCDSIFVELHKLIVPCFLCSRLARFRRHNRAFVILQPRLNLGF